LQIAEILHQPEWAEDERFKSNTARVNHRSQIEELIREKLIDFSSGELIALLRKNGIPVGLVNTIKQALATEQAQAKEMVIELDHKKIGKFKTLGVPVKMANTPSSIRYAPPLLGEHTDEVLAHYLNLSKDVISELKTKKIVA
jgi:crotonobetainyl-CoA:carnitine CoA-transferase CaiB-like acyl-CoA transferase